MNTSTTSKPSRNKRHPPIYGWEDESYLILELDNSGLHKVLETFGG